MKKGWVRYLINLLIPTRKRPHNLKRLIENVKNSVFDLNNIEFCFYIDDDDTESLEIITNAASTIHMVAIQGTYIPSQRTPTFFMHNELVKICTRPIIFYGADDIMFRTNHWDKIIIDLFDKYEDKILLAYAPDGFQTGQVPVATHGFIHRNWIDLIGYLFPPIFNVAYNDTWITEVSERIHRRFYLTDMYVEHMHPAANKAKWDDVYLSKKETDGNEKAIFDQLIRKREDDASKLLKFIEIFK